MPHSGKKPPDKKPLPKPPLPARPVPGAKSGVSPQSGTPIPAEKPANSQLDLTAHLLSAVLGASSSETASVQAVFKALGQPGQQVVLELPWYADGGTHQLVLKSRFGDRVTFFNPLGHPGKRPGDELLDGLRRRVEADGTESASLSDFEQLFRSGKARALISSIG